ncbi:MAG: hypothetical protein VB050_08510 [Geobacteraceae bacterium]|nr:hypothetical protein [Geobacteraceae bacterium]
MREAAAQLASRKSVCIFINAKTIEEPGASGQESFPNHWVVMMSEPMIDGQSIFSFPDATGLDNKKIDFNVFTWGKIQSINLKRTNTVRDFLNHYYGFVAAEYPSAPSSFEFKVFSWWIQHHGYNHNNLLGW